MAATRFVIRNYSRNGLSISFELVAVDASGAIDTAYAGTASFSSNNSTIPGLPASYVFTAGDAGVRAFSTTVQTIENVQIYAVDNSAVLTQAGIYIGGNGPDTSTGGNGGDVFDPNGGANTLTGNDGEDIFYLNGGTSTLHGGPDMDRLVINWGGGGISNTVALTGSLGAGYSGTIAGGGFSAAFQGIENFTINTFNNDSDNVTTGDGEDEYSQLALDSPSYIRDTANLGGGIDRISVDARATNGALSFLVLNYDGSGEIALYGNGKLGFSNAERFLMQGGNAGDDLRGLDFTDRLDGNGGNDRLAGRGGADDLRGGAGSDLIDGDGRVTMLLAADNQNNAGTGVSDGDFRVSGVYNASNPAEFDLAVGTGNVGTVRLRLRVTDVETQAADPLGVGSMDEVYVNGVLVGMLAQGADNATGDTIITFDAALLASGTAQIRIQNVNSNGAYGMTVQDVELTLEKTGADRLDGGAGIDQLVGGRGDDVYVVDDERDQAQEQAGQGADTVLSGARAYTLGANIDNMAAMLSLSPAQLTGETQINTDIVAATQHPRGVTVLNDGGYVVTWQDVNNGTDARGRVFNADGSARSAEFTVNPSPAGNQAQYGLGSVALANGGFLVAYYENLTGPNSERIAGRVYDANGIAQGADYTLTDSVGTFDSFPAMARLNDGRIALLSQNGGTQDGNGTFGIRYTLLNADGSVGAGAPTIFQTTTGGDQVGPAVAKLDDGRLIVVWESGEPGGKVFRGRYIDANGAPTGNDFAISSPGGESPDSGEVRAQVTAINGGGFAVVWGITNEIVGRVFDSAGFPVGGEFTVNQRSAGAQTTVAITRLAEGGFMAAWTSDQGEDGDAQSVVARLFNADGSARGDDFVVNQIGTRFQLFPEMATLPDGRVVVVFSSDVPGSGSNYEGKQIILDTTPDQVLVGNELANSVTGGFANDILAGSGGGDTLTGNQGADLIFGGDYRGSGTNLIVNGSFETQDGANITRDFILAAAEGTFDGVAYRGTASLFGWQRGTAANTELNTVNGSPLYAVADGTSNINLEYLGGQNQIIFQDVAGLAAGEKYLLKFAANQFASPANYTATMQVLWNGAVIDTVTPQTKTPAFYSYILQAAATGSGAGGANRLEFREIGSGDGIGTTLDAVSLETLAAAPDMAVGALGPNLIVNGSFEQRDATTTSRDYVLAVPETGFNGGDPVYRFSDQLLGWGFLTGSSRVEFNTDNPNIPRNEYQTGDGLVGLDLEGSPGEQHGLFQDVAGLDAGQRHRITVSAALWLGPLSNLNAAVQVIWNGRVVGTVTPTSAIPVDYSFDVIAQAVGAGLNGANRLAFQAVNGGSGRGVNLDHVRLNLVAAADAGADTVDYSRESGTGNVIANLAAGTATDSFGNADRLFGIENVKSGAGNDSLTGDGGANRLDSGGGADTLDGGAGADAMIGGAGDDLYFVDDGGDTVTEIAGEGTDEVRTGLASYTLAAEIERLTGTVNTGQALTGNGLANTIAAGGGNDSLDGGAGADAMTGGAGDDSYVVDNAADTAIENAAGGTDEIRTALASYTLASANVENLRGTSNAGQSLTGDSAANSIFGADGDDVLSGGGGADSLAGGLGNDTYLVDGLDDIVTEAANAGTDEIRTGLASYTLASANVENLIGTSNAGQTLTGDGAANTITGADGNDTLDGGAGNDVVNGGAGNDAILVSAGIDTVNGGADSDTVTINYSAQGTGFFNDAGGDVAFSNGVDTSVNISGVERIIITTGNGADNIMTLGGNDEIRTGGGNDTLNGAGGNDLLDGGAGADAMTGGLGDDIFVVDDAGDSVTENAEEGTDEIRTSLASYSIAALANVENLTGTFGGGQILTGNAGVNVIIGAAGGDYLDGGGGADSLRGGGGDDIYVIDDAGDAIVELANEGRDYVATKVSLTLAAGVEAEIVSAYDQRTTDAFNLTGNAFNQDLIGNAGANTLDGGGGTDRLIGLGGDDLYLIDDASDLVIEFAGDGNDTVKTSVSWSLLNDAEVESVQAADAAGLAAIDLNGNAHGQELIGNAGTNQLNGGGGADRMVGLGGDDFYLLDNGGDSVIEAAGGGRDYAASTASWVLAAGQEVETISTLGHFGLAAIDLTGNEFSQDLIGNNGANSLDGGGGADRLIGLGGDDFYVIDNAGDSVFEDVGAGGRDYVASRASWTLSGAAEVEVLSTLAQGGTDAIDLTGNGFGQDLIGNAGANQLNGGGGADRLIGLGGDDFYIIDSADDSVIEFGGDGQDYVGTRVSWTLAAGQEVETVSTLSHGGTDAIDLTGNELANTMIGNEGANVLNGGGGADRMVGLGGVDSFVFNSALGGSNVDQILDMTVGVDKIILDDAVFAGLALGALAAGAFNTGATASDADDRILYDAASGALYFDADGAGGAAAVQFASVSAGLAITASEFTVI